MIMVGGVPMTDGFLGYRTSLMLDVVVCALAVLVPLLVYSLYEVKVRRNYLLHRNLQILLGAVLFIAVGLFEVDMRMQGGIDAILSKRDVPLSLAQRGLFDAILYTHLVFAISTPFLWIATIAHGLWYFESPPMPGPASRRHKLFGWAASADITLTSITGLLVYYFGFVV
jgi:putative membrane protein